MTLDSFLSLLGGEVEDIYEGYLPQDRYPISHRR